MLEMLMLYMSLIETEEEKVKFEKIYVQYRKLMYVCAKEILRSDHLAEDAVHEAFLKIAKYLDKIEFPCNKTLCRYCSRECCKGHIINVLDEILDKENYDEIVEVLKALLKHANMEQKNALLK